MAEITSDQPITDSQPPAVAQKTDNGEVPKTWDEIFEHTRFKQLLDKSKIAEAKVAEYEKAEQEKAKQTKEAEEKRLAEQQKYLELADKRKGELDETTTNNTRLQEQLDRQTAVLTALYESRKDLVPEMYRSLLDSMDIVDRLDWLAKNEKQLKPQNGGIPHTPQPEGKGELTPEERRRKAARTF